MDGAWQAMLAPPIVSLCPLEPRYQTKTDKFNKGANVSKLSLDFNFGGVLSWTLVSADAGKEQAGWAALLRFVSRVLYVLSSCM